MLFVARLVEKKGCTYMLRAVESLPPRFPELTLTIAGDGELRPSLEREAANRGINVEFIGSEWGPQIRERLACSWVFAAPSITAESGDTEGLSMVFLEAQAPRSPVVSLRSGGAVEEVSGLLCDEKDVWYLSANIARMLENSSLRQDMVVGACWASASIQARPLPKPWQNITFARPGATLWRSSRIVSLSTSMAITEASCSKPQ